MPIIGTALHVGVQSLFLSNLPKVLFCPSHFGGLHVLYMGAISDSMYFIGHICFMWLLLYLHVQSFFIKFKHKLVFLKAEL